MKIPRRDFLKMTVVTSAASTLASLPLAAAESKPAGSRELYELRAYRLKPDAPHALLDRYLESALLPALNQQGVKNVGVFTEAAPKDGPAVWVLAPYESAEAYVRISASITEATQAAPGAADYLNVGKDAPAFDRIDSWLLLAFAGLPKIELPPYSVAKQPRIYEIRTYESFSEAKALKKVAMFNDGEIDVMREVGLAPVFYGQALTGRDLPHLTYMLSAPDAEAHKQHWEAFRKHPTWLKMKSAPEYADTVSKITTRTVTPTAYSQI
jgi:hypothetical protein